MLLNQIPNVILYFTLGDVQVIKESLTRDGSTQLFTPKVMMGVTQHPIPKFLPKIEI